MVSSSLVKASSVAVSRNIRQTTTTTTTTTIAPAIDPALWAAEEQARIEAASFSSLFDTVLSFYFSNYGYPRSVAQYAVSKDAVREACAVAVEVPPPRMPVWVVDENCTFEEIARQLHVFINREEYNYFLYYVAIAVPLITLAIVFNTLAVAAVCRIKRRQPRHVIAISLSVSDVVLSATTLLKRCGAVEADDGPLTNPLVRNILQQHHQDINIFWQAAFAMSALGLVCMAADNLVAVAAPFSYGQFTSSSWFVGVMPTLWGVVLVIMLALRMADLSQSYHVQQAVAAIMCTLLFVILSAYGFTCFQALLYRRRTDQWAQPEQKVTMRRRLLKGFMTTTLLVLTCFLSWGPLVCFLFVDKEVLYAAHPVFLKFALFCLVMFHLGAVFNPIIYSMRIRGIRVSLFQMLKLSSQTNQTNQSTTCYKRQQTTLQQRRSQDGCVTPSSAATLSSTKVFNKTQPKKLSAHLQVDFKMDGGISDSQVLTTPACYSTEDTPPRLSGGDSMLGLDNSDEKLHQPITKRQSRCVDESVGPDTAMDNGDPIILYVPEMFDSDTSPTGINGDVSYHLRAASQHQQRGRWSTGPPQSNLFCKNNRNTDNNNNNTHHKKCQNTKNGEAEDEIGGGDISEEDDDDVEQPLRRNKNNNKSSPSRPKVPQHRLSSPC